MVKIHDMTPYYGKICAAEWEGTVSEKLQYLGFSSCQFVSCGRGDPACDHWVMSDEDYLMFMLRFG